MTFFIIHYMNGNTRYLKIFLLIKVTIIVPCLHAHFIAKKYR